MNVTGARRYAPDELAHEQHLARVRSAVDEETFATVRAERAAMLPERAIAYAPQELDADALLGPRGGGLA